MLKNEQGFTLIEMLIVLLVISVLLIITIPNLTQNSGSIKDKGCAALIATAEAQSEAYYIENNEYPASLDTLQTAGYIKQTTCPNGDELSYETSGSGQITSAPVQTTP